MKNKKNKAGERLVINASQIPLEGNLGLLAYGDIAFTAWRELKSDARKNDSDETK